MMFRNAPEHLPTRFEHFRTCFSGPKPNTKHHECLKKSQLRTLFDPALDLIISIQIINQNFNIPFPGTNKFSTFLAFSDFEVLIMAWIHAVWLSEFCSRILDKPPFSADLSNALTSNWSASLLTSEIWSWPLLAFSIQDDTFWTSAYDPSIN